MRKSLNYPLGFVSYVLLVLNTYNSSNLILQEYNVGIDSTLRFALSLLLSLAPFLIIDVVILTFHNHQGFLSVEDGLPTNMRIVYKHAFQKPTISTLPNNNIHVDFGNGYTTFSSVSANIQNIECFGSLAISVININTNSHTYVGNWKEDN